MIHMIATRPSAAPRTRPLSRARSACRPTRPLAPSPRSVGQPPARRGKRPPAPGRTLLLRLTCFAILLTALAGMLILTLLTPALPAVRWLTTGFYLTFALVALIAAGLLVLVLLLRPAHTRRFVPSAAWQRCYCFSGEGQMSAEILTHFLRSHPGWEPVTLPTRVVLPAVAVRSASPLAA